MSGGSGGYLKFSEKHGIRASSWSASAPGPFVCLSAAAFYAGVGFSFFHRGKNSLQVGVEYAPVFLDDQATVINLSFAFGWQLL